MNLYQITWTSQGEKEWIAAPSLIGAIKAYCELASFDISDFDDEDEIVEIPKDDWGKMDVANTEYDENDPDDKETFAVDELMKDCHEPMLIAGTMYP